MQSQLKVPAAPQTEGAAAYFVVARCRMVDAIPFDVTTKRKSAAPRGCHMHGLLSSCKNNLGAKLLQKLKLH